MQFESIKRYAKLLKERSHPPFWSQYIIDAYAYCKDEVERRHFYMYIVNPSKYDPDVVMRTPTLRDMEKLGQLSYDIEAYPPGMETRVYENSTGDYILDVRKVNTDEDDEKICIGT